MSIYLDYNASNPIDKRVIKEICNIYENVIGNADSRTHDFGEGARKIVESARENLAKLLNVNSDEVFFTSGATESNNIAIQGLKEYGLSNNKTHIITSSIEHKAVLETVKYMETQGFEVDFIKPNKDGLVEIESIVSKIKDNTLLVSLMHVNNETGVIQDVDKLGEYLKEKNILFHIDATQSVGKLVKEIQNLNYNILSLSAHKFGGPQGIGALILKRHRYRLPPVKNITFGGSQEKGIRPGTVPVALIGGLGLISKIALSEYKDKNEKSLKIKNQILELIKNSGLNYKINGDLEKSISNTLNVSFIGKMSEALMLVTKDIISISNGSACTSNNYSGSYVLKEMGLDENIVNSAVRISFDGSDSDNFIENFKLFLDKISHL